MSNEYLICEKSYHPWKNSQKLLFIQADKGT